MYVEVPESDTSSESPKEQKQRTSKRDYLFKFRLLFEGIEVEGSAKTKQNAKHNAAEVSYNGLYSLLCVWPAELKFTFAFYPYMVFKMFWPMVEEGMPTSCKISSIPVQLLLLNCFQATWHVSNFQGLNLYVSCRMGPLIVHWVKNWSKSDTSVFINSNTYYCIIESISFQKMIELLKPKYPKYFAVKETFDAEVEISIFTVTLTL